MERDEGCKVSIDCHNSTTSDVQQVEDTGSDACHTSHITENVPMDDILLKCHPEETDAVENIGDSDVIEDPVKRSTLPVSLDDFSYDMKHSSVKHSSKNFQAKSRNHHCLKIHIRFSWK